MNRRKRCKRWGLMLTAIAVGMMLFVSTASASSRKPQVDVINLDGKQVSVSYIEKNTTTLLQAQATVVADTCIKITWRWDWNSRRPYSFGFVGSDNQYYMLTDVRAPYRQTSCRSFQRRVIQFGQWKFRLTIRDNFQPALLNQLMFMQVDYLTPLCEERCGWWVNPVTYYTFDGGLHWFSRPDADPPFLHEGIGWDMDRDE